jgi:stage III sporulation protein AH
VQYVAAEAQDSQQSEQTPQSVETGKKASEFEEMRAQREQTRNEALATLQEIIDDTTLGSAEKNAAVNSIAQLTERMEQEAAVETLVRGKGFADCVVVISETQVNVLVPAASGALTSSDAAVIKDIVIGQVNISPSSIKIIEVK